jgi:hypothetical protein
MIISAKFINFIQTFQFILTLPKHGFVKRGVILRIVGTVRSTNKCNGAEIQVSDSTIWTDRRTKLILVA